MENSCPLCKDVGSMYYEDGKHRFYSCPNCLGLFRDPSHLPAKQLEKERYLLHRNSLDDQGYLKFVKPLLQAVKKVLPIGSKGLDYGCGHTPVISVVLEKEGYSFELFDPFFFPNEDSLKNRYDLITCCEVMEHFHHPKAEFELLHNLLVDGGKLFCMTDLYEDHTEFGSWYYKNDVTHVFIYRIETLLYIKEKLGFQDVKVEGRLSTFVK